MDNPKLNINLLFLLNYIMRNILDHIDVGVMGYRYEAKKEFNKLCNSVDRLNTSLKLHLTEEELIGFDTAGESLTEFLNVTIEHLNAGRIEEFINYITEFNYEEE